MYHYAPLRSHLASRADEVVRLSYQEIERIIGRPLPPSARSANRRQWWANTTSHSQARAWLQSGRTAKIVGEEQIEFLRRPPPDPNGELAPPDLAELLPGLTGLGRRLVEEVMGEEGASATAAAVALLNRYAWEQMSVRITALRSASKFSTVTAAELIREDRDAR